MPILDVVGIDPDTKCPSYALVRDGELQAVLYERGGPRIAPPWPRAVPAWCEAQFIDRSSDVPDKDILALALAAGQSSMHFDVCRFISPRLWKGDVSKPIAHAWLLDLVLTPAEKCVVSRYKQKTILREVLDAVGIALCAAGRFPPPPKGASRGRR